jgi:hypothetical protein
MWNKDRSTKNYQQIRKGKSEYVVNNSDIFMYVFIVLYVLILWLFNDNFSS